MREPIEVLLTLRSFAAGLNWLNAELSDALYETFHYLNICYHKKNWNSLCYYFLALLFFGVGGLFLLFIRLAMGIFSESTFLAFITER